jgi:hypothetical protein
MSALPGLTGTDLISTILNFVYLGFFVILMFFSQKIQGVIMNRQVSKALGKLKIMRDKGKQAITLAIKDVGKPTGDPMPRLERLLMFFTIPPEGMDPAGVVQRLEHLFDTADSRIRDEIRAIAPNADESQLLNLQNLLEAAQALNTLYRVVRHYYLLGKKEGSLYSTVQVQMQLPTIMEEAEAYLSFLDAFKQNKPVGDGVGALVASKLIGDNQRREIAKEMVVAETSIEGRRILATKAKGPGGAVGWVGDAVNALMEENAEKVALIVMVDAGLKLEGEDSGDVAEGIGAAIGGIGVDKYKIEEAATKHNIPVYAIIVKESLKEVLAPMTEAISRAADKAVAQFKTILKERTKEGETVIVVGVGNTLGIN